MQNPLWGKDAIIIVQADVASSFGGFLRCPLTLSCVGADPPSRSSFCEPVGILHMIVWHYQIRRIGLQTTATCVCGAG